MNLRLFVASVVTHSFLISSMSIAQASSTSAAYLNLQPVPYKDANPWLKRGDILNSLSLGGVISCFLQTECGRAMSSLDLAEQGLNDLSTKLLPQYEQALVAVQNNPHVVHNLRRSALTLTNGDSAIKMHAFIDGLEQKGEKLAARVADNKMSIENLKSQIKDLRSLLAEQREKFRYLQFASAHYRSGILKSMSDSHRIWSQSVHQIVGQAHDFVVQVAHEIQYTNANKHIKFLGEACIFSEQDNAVYLSNEDALSLKVLFGGPSGASSSLRVSCPEQNEFIFPGARLQPVRYLADDNMVVAPQNFGAWLEQDWRQVIVPVNNPEPIFE